MDGVLCGNGEKGKGGVQCFHSFCFSCELYNWFWDLRFGLWFFFSFFI